MTQEIPKQASPETAEILKQVQDDRGGVQDDRVTKLVAESVHSFSCWYQAELEKRSHGLEAYGTKGGQQ